ncbi:MAG: hypothetical protein ACREBC_26205, partial [Pyrinomonadaceae bacterium]
MRDKSAIGNRQSEILVKELRMHFRFFALLSLCLALCLSLYSPVLAQGGSAQSDLSALQRLDVMRSKLDSMRRSLNSAISGLGSKTENQKDAPDDPRQRLKGLEKEVSSIL